MRRTVVAAFRLILNLLAQNNRPNWESSKNGIPQHFDLLRAPDEAALKDWNAGFCNAAIASGHFSRRDGCIFVQLAIRDKDKGSGMDSWFCSVKGMMIYFYVM